MSSYLLTEIALEMLGYTFYDVNGNFEQTSFQQGGVCTKMANNISIKSLGIILGLVPSVRNINDVVTDVEINEVGGDTKTLSSEVDHIWLHTEPASISSRLWPSALKKLLDLEYDRISNQMEQAVLRNKAACGEINDYYNQTERQNHEIMLQELLQKFVAREKLKLEKESQIVTVFRKSVEVKTCRINRVIFNKYKCAFDCGQTKELNL